MAQVGAGIATVASAASSIMGGGSRYSEGMTQALIAETQAKDTDLQALQSSERRREDLRASMAAVIANRAARGLSLDTPTGMAIEKELRRQSVRDEGVERLGYMNRSGALRLQSAQMRKGARMGLVQGYLGAAGTVAQGASNFAASGGFGGGK